jgi:hypothetical protein
VFWWSKAGMTDVKKQRYMLQAFIPSYNSLSASIYPDCIQQGPPTSSLYDARPPIHPTFHARSGFATHIKKQSCLCVRQLHMLSYPPLTAHNAVHVLEAKVIDNEPVLISYFIKMNSQTKRLRRYRPQVDTPHTFINTINILYPPQKKC